MIKQYAGRELHVNAHLEKRCCEVSFQLTPVLLISTLKAIFYIHSKQKHCSLSSIDLTCQLSNSLLPPCVNFLCFLVVFLNLHGARVQFSFKGREFNLLLSSKILHWQSLCCFPERKWC